MKKILIPLWLKENLKKQRFKKSKSILKSNEYWIIKNGKLRREIVN